MKTIVVATQGHLIETNIYDSPTRDCYGQVFSYPELATPVGNGILTSRLHAEAAAGKILHMDAGYATSQDFIEQAKALGKIIGSYTLAPERMWITRDELNDVTA